MPYRQLLTDEGRSETCPQLGYMWAASRTVSSANPSLLRAAHWATVSNFVCEGGFAENVQAPLRNLVENEAGTRLA